MHVEHFVGPPLRRCDIPATQSGMRVAYQLSNHFPVQCICNSTAVELMVDVHLFYWRTTMHLHFVLESTTSIFL